MNALQEVVAAIAKDRGRTLEWVIEEVGRFDEDCEDVLAVLRGSQGPCTELIPYLDRLLNLNEDERWAVTAAIRYDALAQLQREGWIEEGDATFSRVAGVIRSFLGRVHRGALNKMIRMSPMFLCFVAAACSDMF